MKNLLHRRKAFRAAGGGPFGGHSTLGNNLVAYYKFDGSSGAVVDEEGTHDGTITGSITRSATGKINDAFSWPSSGNAYITLANDSDFAFTGDFSISAWISLTSSTTQQQVVARRDGGFGTIQYQIQIISDSIALQLDNGSTVYGASTAIGVDGGAWQHVVVVCDSNVLKIYLDNSKTTGDTFSGSRQSSTATRIGCNFSSGSPVAIYRGDMDEVGFWSRALTDAEVSDLYNSGSGLTY